LLDDLVAKLRQSGAAAAVIVPYWPKKSRFLYLFEMSIDSVDMPLSHVFFSAQRQ